MAGRARQAKRHGAGDEGGQDADGVVEFPLDGLNGGDEDDDGK